MGEQGSVAWMFERRSQIFVPGDKATEDQLMNIILDAGADDLRNQGDQWEILSDPASHESVLKVLETNGIPTEDPSIAWVPKNLIKLEGKNASGMLRLQDALEDHDDVQSVYSNFDIDEKELEALSQLSASPGHRLRLAAHRLRRNRQRWRAAYDDCGGGDLYQPQEFV
jgi:transcriptional/translational regulatory protein YebC/TACO1